MKSRSPFDRALIFYCSSDVTALETCIENKKRAYRNVSIASEKKSMPTVLRRPCRPGRRTASVAWLRTSRGRAFQFAICRSDIGRVIVLGTRGFQTRCDASCFVSSPSPVTIRAALFLPTRREDVEKKHDNASTRFLRDAPMSTVPV